MDGASVRRRGLGNGTRRRGAYPPAGLALKGNRPGKAGRIAHVGPTGGTMKEGVTQLRAARRLPMKRATIRRLGALAGLAWAGAAAAQPPTISPAEYAVTQPRMRLFAPAR